MHIRYIALVIGFSLTVFQCILCQPTSFQISMDVTGHRLADVAVNEEDRLMLMFYGPPFTISSQFLYMMDITDGANSQSASRLSFSSTTLFHIRFRANFRHDKITMMQTLTQGLSPVAVINHNTTTGQTWIRKAGTGGSRGDFAQDETGNIIIVQQRNSLSSPDLAAYLYKLDSMGNNIWSKWLRFNKIGMDPQPTYVYELGYIAGEGIYLSGKFGEFNSSPQDEHFVMKLDADGTPAIMKTIGNHALTQLYTAHDGIYLLGKSSAGSFPFTGNTSNAVLAKFDRQLEFQWAKVFHAQAFEYARATLNIAADSTLVLGYSTFGAFPVVLARLDAAGNILWQKGVPPVRTTG